MKSRILLVVAGIIAGTPTLFAHSGHGEPGDGNSMVHFLTEPEHVIVIVAAVAGIAALVSWRRRRRTGENRG